MRKAAEKTIRIIQMKEKNKVQHDTSRTQTQNTTNTNTNIRKHIDNEAGSAVQHEKVITCERHNKRRKKIEDHSTN
jgi:hypothetical protein